MRRLPVINENRFTRQLLMVVVSVISFGSHFETAVIADEACKGFRILQKLDGWMLSEGDQKVLFYQSVPKDLNGEYRRANYVHPLFDLDGKVLTEDFPQDHLHHRGIFWSWHQLLVKGKPAGDPWIAQDFNWDVKNVEIAEWSRQRVALRAHVHWKSPAIVDRHNRQIPIAEESTLIRVHRSTSTRRMVDFEISLRAKMENVSLGGSDDVKGYGGFCVRIKLPVGLKFSGRDGLVEPQVTAVEAGPWLDFSTAESGITVLSHPSNPAPGNQWILRRQRSMQNPVFPGRAPITVPTSEPIKLKYRLVIHRGAGNAQSIERWQSEFNDEAW